MKKEGVDGRKQNMRSAAMPVIHWNCLLCLSPDSGQGLLFGGQRQNSRWQMCRVALPQPGADGHWGRKVFGVAWWGCVRARVEQCIFFQQCTASFHPAVGKRLWWFPCLVRSGKPSRRQKVPFSKTTVWSSLPKGTATRTWQGWAAASDRSRNLSVPWCYYCALILLTNEHQMHMTGGDFDGDLNMLSFCPQLIALAEATEHAVAAASMEDVAEALRNLRFKKANVCWWCR